MANFCENCGTELQGNEQHCPECGKPIIDLKKETLKYYKNQEKRANTSRWFKNSIFFVIGAIVFLFLVVTIIINTN